MVFPSKVISLPSDLVLVSVPLASPESPSQDRDRSRVPPGLPRQPTEMLSMRAPLGSKGPYFDGSLECFQ